MFRASPSLSSRNIAQFWIFQNDDCGWVGFIRHSSQVQVSSEHNRIYAIKSMPLGQKPHRRIEVEIDIGGRDTKRT